MSDKSPIEWTDATWNPQRGCKKVDLDCKHCYAERVARRFSGPGLAYADTVTKHGHWNGKVFEMSERLADPLRWRAPRRVFVGSMTDMFIDEGTRPFLAAVFGVMAACPQHTFQILTKRPENAADWFDWIAGHARPKVLTGVADPKSYNIIAECKHYARHYIGRAAYPAKLDRYHADMVWPLPNVWIGTSIGHDGAMHRLAELKRVPASLRFLSMEPLHQPVGRLNLDGIGWVIVGGESGNDARPMHPDWARAIRDQCVEAKVPFFFKQWGKWSPCVNERHFTHGGPERQPHAWVDAASGASGHVWLYDSDGTWQNWTGDFTGGDVHPSMCVMGNHGKKHSGRLLDGRTWDEMPGSTTGRTSV